MANIKPGFRLRRGKNLGDLTDASQARGNLGVPWQASQDDTNASKVMRVGAFGLGDIGEASALALTDIESGTEARLKPGNGFYSVDNNPTPTGPLPVSPIGYDPLIRLGAGADGTRGIDLWFHTSADRAFMRRRGFNAAWSSWVELAHTGNLPATYATNGYQKILGGLVIQWGYNTTSFPIAFPNVCVNVQVTDGGSADGSVDTEVSALTKTGFSLANAGDNFYYMAIGY